MFRRAPMSLLLAVCLWFTWSSANAVTEGRISLSGMIERASVIAIGTVFDMTSSERFFGDHTRVVTDVSLVEVDIVKGEPADTGLTVTQFGGRVGDVVEWYPGLPNLDADRRYIVFLLRTELGDAIPIGMQGLFLIEVDPERAVEVVTSSNGQPVIKIEEDFVQLGALSQETPAAKAKLSDAMTLEAFLDEINARMD